MKNYTVSRVLAGALALLLLCALAACGARRQTPDYPFGSSAALSLSGTDYADADNWLRFGGDKSKRVDIFAVYPTVTNCADTADTPYIRLDSPLMRENAEAWLARVRGIIEPSGNVYAPLYRQLNGAMLERLGSAEFESYTYATPRDDIFAAFAYFLTNINKGERPFILFGHSQGAALVAELATSFLGNKAYHLHNTNHIITYAVGYPVTAAGVAKNPNLAFSERRDDTGVIVSWNTVAPSEIASGAYKRFGTWNPDGLVTNPISWTTNETLAHAAANGASRVALPGKAPEMIGGYANALVDKEHSVLVTTTVNEADYPPTIPTIGRFHPADMSLYHDSMMRNIKDRIQAFMTK